MELQEIHETVCNYLNLNYDHKQHDKRQTKEVIMVRQFTTYFAREFTDLSFFKIGSFYAKDHSNTILGLQRIEGLIQFDKIYQKYEKDIRSILKPPYGVEDIFKNIKRLNRIVTLIKRVELLIDIKNDLKYINILQKRKQKLIDMYLKSKL